MTPTNIAALRLLLEKDSYLELMEGDTGKTFILADNKDAGGMRLTSQKVYGFLKPIFGKEVPNKNILEAMGIALPDLLSELEAHRAFVEEVKNTPCLKNGGCCDIALARLEDKLK